MRISSEKPASASSDDRETSAAGSLAPEFDLLLACCGEHSGNQREGLIRAILQQSLDWDDLTQAAEHHGVIPRLYENLAANAGLVPAAALQAIYRLYEANTRRTLWLTRELARVLAHFQSAGIPALPYKGPTLAQSLYEDVAKRQFSDLDILIHARDFSRAQAALLELGFEPGLELTPKQERAYLRSGYEFTFDSPNGRNLLEIQWQILPRFYSVEFDMDGFFDRAVTQQVAGMVVGSLRAQDLLLALCAHAWKHAWIQLSWLCDISALAKTPDLDWDLVWRQATALGMRRMVAVTFVLAHRLLGAALPRGAQSDSCTESFADAILPLIKKSTPFNTESMAYFRLMASLRERRHHRARFWWQLALTPSVGEWSAIRLPEPLFPLYRLVRVFRLARRLIA